MEPKDEKLLRDKIEATEKKHADWNRDKVLAGLNFATTTKKKKPLLFYFSAAASLLIAFAVFYNFSATRVYQARTNTPNILSDTDTATTPFISPAASEILVAENNFTPLIPKKVKPLQNKVFKKEVAIPVPAIIPITEPAIAENVEVKIVRKKKIITPIIGVIYNNDTPKEKIKKLPLQIEFGKQNTAQNLAYQENDHLLQTSLN
jgi:hypothetical protein